MRIKNKLSFILALMLAITFTVPAYAFENTASADEGYSGLYIVTNSVPVEVINHTKNSIAGIIDDSYDINTITVGQPFVVKGHGCDLYYFLVYSNNDLVGHYRVFYTEDNGYTGIFSETPEILDGFKELEGKTSPNVPAEIVVGDYEDLYAVTATEEINVLADPQKRTTSKVEPKLLISSNATRTSIMNEKSDISVVNAKEGIDFSIPQKNTRATGASKFLAIGWAETQGSEPWCAAYVTATICRYIKGSSSITAKSVMKYTYPDATTAELKKKSLSRKQAVAFGKSKGLSPERTNIRMSWAAVKTDINAGNPIYFACKNITDTSGANHAIACRGYRDSSNSYYSVWNPWYEKFEKVYTSDSIYTTNTGVQYKYCAAIYSWGDS